MKISVVTATYNRADLIDKLYYSINENYKTHKEIEWLIMDDGSTDNTKEVVSNFIKDSKYEIKYFYQKNCGKMNAINNVIKHVTGDIIIEMDSDDYFLDNAFKTINLDYEKLSKDAYGILYTKKLIGKTNDDISSLNNKIIRLYDIHYNYNFMCDMALTFKADIRKKYCYKLEKNEKFITEARMYYEMDFNSKGLLVKDKDIMECVYQDDGYTSKIKELFKKYPNGYYEFFKEALNYSNNIKFNKRIYLIKHFILFNVLLNNDLKKSLKEIIYFKNKFLIRLLYIPGKIKTLLNFK